MVIWYKNFGHTPARNIRVRFFCYTAPNLSSAYLKELTEYAIEAGIAAPGHQRRTFDTFTLTEDELKRLEMQQFFVVLRISYTYEDEGGTEFSETADYYLDAEGMRHNIFYIFSNNTRENWDEFAQRSLFDGPVLSTPRAKRKRRKRKPRPHLPTSSGDDDGV